MADLPVLRGPHVFTDSQGVERRPYVTTNPDRRTTGWRRMKKDIAEQAALKLKKEMCNVET